MNSSFPAPISDIVLDYYLNVDVTDYSFPQRFNFFDSEKNIREKLAAHYVLWGNQDKVESMIIANPTLLTLVMTGTSPVGQVKGTLYQMALGMGDYYIKNSKGLTMASMIQSYLISYTNATEAKKQQDLQFPAGWQEKEISRQQTDYRALVDVWQTIQDSKAIDREALDNDVKVQTALKKFKGHLTPTATMSTGLYINVKLLADAFILLADVFNKIFNNIQFKYMDYCAKFDLYCQQVLGLIEQQLPACDVFVLLRGAQVIAASNYDSVHNIPRTLKFGRQNLDYKKMFQWRSHESSIHYYDCDEVKSSQGLQLGSNAYVDLWSRLYQSHGCDDLLGQYPQAGQSWHTYLGRKCEALQNLLTKVEELAVTQQSIASPSQPKPHTRGQCTIL